MAYTIQLRRDTAANWTSVNPVLAQGETGIETDTGNSKTGNGSSAWSALGYWAAGGVPVYSVRGFGARGDGVTDDHAAIQAAMNVAGPIGAAVYFPPGNYLISAPLLWDRTAQPTGSLCPALVGSPGRGGKDTDNGGAASSVVITCSSTFPVGEFAIDYLHSNYSLLAPYAGGLKIECANRAAGIRVVNQNGGIWERIDIYSAATPAPANNLGSPSAAFNFLKGTDIYGPYNNIVRYLFVKQAGQDGFLFGEGAGSGIAGYSCESLNATRYGFWVGDFSRLHLCIDQGSTSASFAMFGRSSIIGCESVTSGGNAIFISGGTTESKWLQRVIGCHFYSDPPVTKTGAAAAAISIAGFATRALIDGCTFGTESAYVSEWVNVASGATGVVQFSNCIFSPQGGAPAQLYNLVAPGVATFSNCYGINPLGALTVTVPASGAATTAQPADCVFYITANASGTTTAAVSNGPTVTIPASSCVPVTVPAGQTLTPTYGTAPTWIVEGL